MGIRQKGPWRGQRIPPAFRQSLTPEQFVAYYYEQGGFIPAVALAVGGVPDARFGGPLSPQRPPKFFCLIVGRSRPGRGTYTMSPEEWVVALMSWRTREEFGSLPLFQIFLDTRPGYEAHIGVGWSEAGSKQYRIDRRVYRFRPERELKMRLHPRHPWYR
jgi:hypothetical protein